MKSPDMAASDGAVPDPATIVGGRGRIFVGREPELAVLRTALEEAVGGSGRLVLLAGHPGVGKTQLAAEFAEQATDTGARVLWGRCWEAGGAPAYWPWIQSLRDLADRLDDDALRVAVGTGDGELLQMLPEVATRLDEIPPIVSASPEVARFRLFDAVGRFIGRAAAQGPLVLVLEDLHGADASSLLLLQFIGGVIGTSAVLVIGTYRDVEVTVDHPLSPVLAELARHPETARLALEGLDESGVARIIGEISGEPPPQMLVTAIHGDTNGNPLFVTEIVRLLTAERRLAIPPDGWRWPIPEGLGGVITRRIERLPSACRETLELASVIGHEFTVQPVEHVTGRDTASVLDCLRSAVEAHVLRDVPDEPYRFRFEHALTREVLYEGIKPSNKVRMHRLVGETLEELYAADPDPHVAELAYHFLEASSAGCLPKGIEYATAAGERAVRLLAFEEAVRLFRMAVRALHDSPDECRRCEVLLLLGDAQGRAGMTADAKESFLEAAGIAIRLNLPEQLAQAALGYGGRLQFQRAGADRHLIPLLRQALEVLDKGDSVLRVRLLSRLAGALRDQLEVDPRSSMAREAVEMARRLGDPDTLIYALIAWWGAVLLGADGVDEMEAVADELDDLATRARDRELLANMTWIRFIHSMSRGRPWEARTQHELAVRKADELGQPPQQWYMGIMATTLALQSGRFADAEALINSTYETGRRIHPWDAEASRLFGLFALRREQAQLEELEAELRDGIVTHPTYRSLRCMILTLLCEAGRFEEAKALLDQLAADDFSSFPKDNEWLFALTLIAEAVDILDDRERAAVLYAQLDPYADLVALAADEFSVGPVSRPLGILAGLLEHHEEATAHFEDALRRTQDMGAPPLNAHARYAYARMLARRGQANDRERALELLAGAAVIADETGMTALADRVSDLQADLGVRRPQRMRNADRSGLGGTVTPLTPREREIAGLVSEGLSNREIAVRLYLSPRTVETHVQNVLMKLGFRSRTQIAKWVLDEQSTDTTT